MAKLLQMPLLFEGLLDLDVPEEPVAQTAQQAPSISEKPVPDAAEREAALDIHRSCIVEAPAGSGKTGLLIQRYLKLLAYGDVEQPGDVLALTFTRKADGEMRRRVLEQLAAAEAREPLAGNAGSFEITTRQLAEATLVRDHSLQWQLLKNPQQLNIRTIDSFCAELAASMPLVAGAGGRYNPTDDPGPLYDRAAESTLLHMGESDPVLTKDLERMLLLRDAQPVDVKRLLADMLRQREQWGELVPLKTEKLTDQALNEEVRPRLNQTLRRLIGRELAATADLIGPDLLGRLATLAHDLSTCPSYDGESSPIALCEGRPHAPSPSAEDLAHWVCLSHLLLKESDGHWRKSLNGKALGFEASATERQHLKDLIAAFQFRDENDRPGLRTAIRQIAEIPDATFPEEQWQMVKSLCRVLRQALLELQLVFAERQACDFSEIALTARSLVCSEAVSADLLSTQVAHLRHLLVDEMQDTSAGQYSLMEALTSSWDGATQTLFLVGDPKQSIYEFRQARVERFRRVMEEGRFGHLDVKPLRLSSNFRSQSFLVEAFNSTFSKILPALGDPSLTAGSVDVPFAAATPTRSAGAKFPLHWHAAYDVPSLTSSAEEPATDTTERRSFGSPTEHARLIRSTIETFLTDWVNRPLVAGKVARAPRVAVLARSRNHLAPIIQEFHQDYGAGPLAFRAVDIEALNERPEILDLLALTRALLDPSDRVAWLSVLRSPVCGLGLDDLLALTGDGAAADAKATVPSLIVHRGHHLSAAGQHLLARAWTTLARAQADLGRSAFSTHVDRTWRTLGGEAPLEEHARNNARRFLDLLHQLEQGPEPISLGSLTRRLRTLYAEPSSVDAAVELMTIHKAKGLEWDLVLIPSLDRGSGRSQQEFLKWLEFDEEDGSSDFVLAPIQGKGEKASRLSTWLTRRQSQREQAEAKRLFYVACTRAREELHLFATVSRRSDGSLKQPRRSDSLLAAGWAAAKVALQDDFQVPTSVGEIVEFPTELSRSISLAAAADSQSAQAEVQVRRTQMLRRLPLHFELDTRVPSRFEPLLPYPRPDTLRTEAAFARPEGSFAARAFGNVVHRFLYLLSMRLADGQSLDDLQAELPTWGPRVQTTLRGEGLSPVQAAAEATRAMQALRSTLSHPEGGWLVSPRDRASSEAILPSTLAAENATFRADRTFFAGQEARSTVGSTHLWIVDYKTTELGGHTREAFLAREQQKYTPQMRAYAEAAVAAGNNPAHIMLALYFPLLPALLSWPYASFRL